MNIGENIKKIRKTKKMTQKDLAKKLGKSIRMIQKYESNEVTPSLEILHKLSEILGTKHLISDETDLTNLFNSLSSNEIFLTEMIFDTLDLDKILKKEENYKLLLEKLENDTGYIPKLAFIYKMLNEIFENTQFKINCEKFDSYRDSLDCYSKKVFPLLFSVGIDNAKNLFNDSELFCLEEVLVVVLNIKSVINNFIKNSADNYFDSSLIDFSDIFDIPENKKILFSMKLVDKNIDDYT